MKLYNKKVGFEEKSMLYKHYTNSSEKPIHNEMGYIRHY